MKPIGFVPSKLNSTRLHRKNVKLLNGRPLINYAIDALAVAGLQDIVVYASDDEVMGFVEPHLPCRFVKRSQTLDGDSVTFQQFASAFLQDVECDIVVLLHATSPFITPSTIRRCLTAVTTGEYESSFAALEIQRFAWMGGKPLNYRLDRPTPRTQDLEPILVEQSGLYVFTRALFERSGRRIATNPYIHIVDAVEGHDIDTPEEFEEAELLVRLAR